MIRTWFDLYKMLNNGSTQGCIISSGGYPVPMSCPPDKRRSKTCHNEIENGCAGCWRRAIPKGTKVVLEFTESANGGVRATYITGNEVKI